MFRWIAFVKLQHGANPPTVTHLLDLPLQLQKFGPFCITQPKPSSLSHPPMLGQLSTCRKTFVKLLRLAKRDAFERFIDTCRQLQTLSADKHEAVREFIYGLLAPNVDARLFEIASYSILKHYYHDERIYWGFSRDEIIRQSQIEFDFQVDQ